MNEPFIIAEIGINHNGNIVIAKQLIKMAKDCGSDAVKFQKRDIDIVYTQEFLKQYRESPWGNTQREQKEGLEFGYAYYEEIDNYCNQIGIEWFASAWDINSQNFLSSFNLPYNKIASAMLTHMEFIEVVAKEGKHTFISTGMSDFEQIDEAVNIFEKHKTPYTLMHCTSVYPCPNDMCNLYLIEKIRDRYCLNKHFKGIGYSGHEKGHIPSVIAVVLGVTVIERHITLDRSMYGSDQAASIERGQLERLCRDVRSVKSMLRGDAKAVIKAETEVAKKLRYWE